MMIVRVALRAAASLVGRLAARLPLIVLTASALLCIAPGFDSDEKTLDPRLSSSTIARLRTARERERDPLRMSSEYLGRLLTGDLGRSNVLGTPVAELARQRWYVTARALALGSGAGWLAALAVAVGVAAFRVRTLRFGATVTTTLLICAPSSVVGLIVSLLNGSVACALAAVVFPRVYQYMDRVLEQACGARHVRMAEAAGVSRMRTFARAALPAAVPEVIAVAGAAANLGIAAIVPLEAVCGAPGLAELAWRSALGRDVPVLLFVTLCLAAASASANAVADTVASSVRWRHA